MSDASLPSRSAPSRGGDAKDSLVLLDSSKLGNLRVDFERLEDDFHAGVVGVFGNVDFVGTGEMLHAGGVCKFGTWFFVCSRCRREMPFYCFHAGKYKAGCFLCRSAGNKRKAGNLAFRRVRPRSNRGLALNGTAVVLGV